MAKDTNQPEERPFTKDELKNYVYLQGCNEKYGFPFLDEDLRKAMLNGVQTYEPSTLFDYPDTGQTARITPRYEKLTGQYGEYYALTGHRQALMENGQETISHFFPTFRKKGLTIEETRNMMNGKAVLNTFYPQDAPPYKRYTALDLTQNDDDGNFKVIHRSASGLDFDMAKGLSQVPFGRGMTQAEKEDIGIRLDKGYDVTFLKRGLDGAMEKFTLYSKPLEGKLMLVDPNGEVKPIPATKINLRAVGVLETQEQEKKEKKAEVKDPALEKAAALVQQPTENKQNGPTKGNRRSAA